MKNSIKTTDDIKKFVADNHKSTMKKNIIIQAVVITIFLAVIALISLYIKPLHTLYILWTILCLVFGYYLFDPVQKIADFFSKKL